eukprot:scaffold96626_cov55-Attheya_sp.AAC.1
MDAGIRTAIKVLIIAALRSTESIARHTAAQACSEVAAVELPYNEWPDFLGALMENVTGEQPDGVKIASLECLGFTCERIALIDNAPDIAPETTDRMLTTIVDGIRADRPDAIRLAAATALRNSLYFTSKNMETKTERDMIMQTICEATQSQDARVRASAYDCIVQIAYLYYSKLADYMQTLFQLTFATIKNDEEAVALRSIEFWSTLCESEMELLDELAECNSMGVPVESGRECVRYVAAALEHLVPLLTETMTKQDEEADLDEETWNISMSGSTCLTLVANTVEDLVVPIVMPFVLQNIKSENWRLREAATMAFSSILEGPTIEVIGPYVNQSIPVLLGALSDPHVLVKDTTAWTIGRICELHVRAIPDETFPTLVNGLMGKLMTETPRVSAQACFAIHSLAAAFSGDESATTSGTNALSAYMPTLLQTLFQVSDREADDDHLRVAAFEAMSVLIQNSAPDCKPLLTQLMPVMAQKLGKDDVVQFADSIMTNLLQLLQTKNATCHQEAFSAMSAMVDLMEADFEKYVSALQPFLMMGLSNFEAFQVCTVAVGLVGDIARAIESKILPYCNDIMSALMQSLQNQSLHRSVKPPVLSCFGDIALAISAGFEPYLQVSLMMLLQASQTRAPPDDEDLIDYVNSLREGILEAYTGIIQGLKDGNRVDLLLPYCEAIMGFLKMVTEDENRDYEVLGKSVGLIGDIASSLGSSVKDQLSQPFVRQLIQDGLGSVDETIIETSNWAAQSLQQAIQ